MTASPQDSAVQGGGRWSGYLSRLKFREKLRVSFAALILLMVVNAIVAALVVLSTIPLYKVLRQDYLPTTADEGEFNVNVTAPQGTSLAAMDEIMAIAREHKLLVIEDAAPALGAEFRGVKVGTIGDVGCYSFQGAKVAIGGQGGALVTNNVAVYEIAKCLASYGRTDSRMPYWSDYVGWNYTMPNLPAALAHSQILRLDGLIEFKRTLFGWYRDGLAGVAGVQVIEEAEGTKSTCCYPPLLVHESVRRSREEILSALRDDNIDARTAQPRISRMPMFTQRFPNSESAKVETHGIILPSAFNLTQGEIEFVCRRIRELVA